MQKNQKPETLYRKLRDRGFIPEEAIQQLQIEGYSSQEVARAVGLEVKRKMARTYEFLLNDPSDPYLDELTYETLQNNIVVIVNEQVRKQESKKGKKVRAETIALSAKGDIVLRSLDKTAISIDTEEIETALNQYTEERATKQTMLGIFLALAIDHFGYDPTAKYQRDVIANIKKFLFPEQLHERKEDTIRNHLKDAAQLFPNAKPLASNRVS